VSTLEQQLQQFMPSLASTVLQQLAAGQQLYGSKEASMLLWVCGVLGYSQERLLEPLALLQQQQLLQARSSSQDVANSMWALGKLGSVQPALLAAAADHDGWLRSSSCQELSLVLYGSAAVLRQQRQQHADAWDLLPAVALWQRAAGQLLSGSAVQGLCAAEFATVLQAAAFVLEPVRRPARKRQQQQQHGSLTGDGNAAASSSNSTAVASMASIASMSSMTCSLDSYEEAAAAAPIQARQLIAAVDEALCNRADAGQLLLPLSAQHIAATLHSLAVAGVSPSLRLQALLVSAATAAARSMGPQQLAMTAWSAAKLFSKGPGRQGVAGLIEAVDTAAGPLLVAMTPQQLSMLAWAHGKLWDLGDSLFMHQLAQAALQQVQAFGPQALSNLTWAFAQLRHYDAALTAAVGRRARALLGQFTPAELSNLAWALVTLRHRHSGLLRAIAGHAAGACSGWDPKACVKLAVTYSSRGMPTHRYRSLLYALADALVEMPARAWSRLTPHEVAQLAVAFAVCRVRHRAAAAQVAAVGLAWLPRMGLYDVVSLVWALAMLGQHHAALLQAVSDRVVQELAAGGTLHVVSLQEQQQHLMALQQQQHPQQQQHLPPQQEQGGAEMLTEPAAVEQQHMQQPAGQYTPAAASTPSGSHSSDGSSSSSSSSSSLKGVPIHAVVGSHVKAQHLARLAWAYRTFDHPDAAWYLAAGQLVAIPMCSSSNSSRGFSSSDSSSQLPRSQLSDCSASSWFESNGNGAQARRSSSSSSSSGGADGTRIGSTDGCTAHHAAAGATAAAPGSAGIDGLMRPHRRPMPAPYSTPGP
jgi:hypothetical protein